MANHHESREGAQEPGYLLHNLLLFAQLLRRLGLDVGSDSMVALVRATEHVPIGRKSDFLSAARSLMVHRKQDLPLFDEAFRVFWRRPAASQTTMDLRSMGEQRRYRQPQVVPPRGADSDAEEAQSSAPGDRPVVDLSRSYSAQEVLRQKDFADFTLAEISSAKRIMAGLAWDLGRRRTRRLVPGPGTSLDLRRTLRRNLKYGGELLDLARRQPREKSRPFVLLCDVSGSMERYTRMLLHFIHSLAAYGRSTNNPFHVEAFLFATRLTRITRYLRHRGIDQAVTEVAKAVPDWAGGTRIGETLKYFNFRWGRRVLGGGAAVLIISDGWDRGEPELLAKEMARLQRSCYRLIWLNPLLGSPGYQPLTQGMQTALTYVDDFLPVHNLNSLEALARHLARLNPRRVLRPSQSGLLSLRRRLLSSATSEAQPPPLPEEPINPALWPTFRHPLWRPIPPS